MSQVSGPGRRTAVTLEAVAKHVQVSRATVSLVLRGSPLVAAATRERVQAAMAELGYIYNRGAAKLRASSSKVIGVLIADLSNPFFGEMTAGVDNALSGADWAVFLANTDESVAKQDSMLRRMREHGVDGVILCPAAGSDERLIHQLADWGLPCVQASRYVSLDASDCVTTDYARGMREATEHLIGLGHRRIALIGGDRQHSATSARCEGYQAAMRHAGLADDLIIGVATTRQAGADALNALLDSPEAPTAAVCYNDFVAHGAITALSDRGMLAGRDFALVGFDDMNEASFCRPPLTTVKTRPYEIGERAGQMLLARMANPDRPIDRVVFPAELVVRASCGAALGVNLANAHNARQSVGA
ncbi:substrate-binding domain-containing protein [Pigmentiphaga aceris]|uniref:Substrate-binding domain-containing protein n=1 Tax=Pigmentiphaga aceris TaxID=1940612 RepID=A0A5C0AUB7_9BURK|nr:LacI family DNA-binding transcriptional regulator [Pigmentiphaga aceris]QEI06009.1 substrate-binding domain-containing protein [Pigmentiphaga aceris]